MKVNNILITGGTGFVGSHMIDYILKHANDKIYVIKRWMEDTSNVDHIDDERLEFIDGDLLDALSIKRAIQISKPDKIFHFAAQSFPGLSFHLPAMTIQTNTVGTTHLLECVKESDYNPIIVSVSTSEVYGMPKEDEVPIKETNPLRAANPYSISKVGHDLMSQYYCKAYGLKIITTRMFSHEGARRGKEFALSSFAHQIAKGEKSGVYTIKHGNLNSVRTYNHIDDAIRAYWICSENGEKRYGEVYNIGGEETCTVGKALDMLISKSDKPFKKQLDKERLRPTDITLQIPCTAKFRNHFNWKPEKSLNVICDDLLKYWRKKI